jgi:hypothetical protein
MIIYLYIKRHYITGLKYFGFTTKTNPFKYKGSGLYWIRHLNKYGSNFNTIEIWGFDDQELCTEFALKFSIENNIVESDEWANLKVEDALPGRRIKGFKTPLSVKSKISKTLTESYKSGKREKLKLCGELNSMFGKTHTTEAKYKQSQKRLNKSWDEIYTSESKNIMLIGSKQRGIKLGQNNKGFVTCIDPKGETARVASDIFHSSNGYYVGVQSNEGKHRIINKDKV